MIHDSATVWGVKHFMTSSAAASLTSRLYFKNKKTADKPGGMLLSWKKVVYLLLETYMTENVTTVSKIEMQNFKMP